MDNNSYLSNGKDIIIGLNVRNATLILNKGLEVANRTSKHIWLRRANKAIYNSVLMKCLDGYV
jgi:hypothetical protein